MPDFESGQSKLRFELFEKKGISTKILLIVLGIFILSIAGLSSVTGITSFRNMSSVTRNELARMAGILAALIEGMEENSIRVVKSFSENKRVADEIRRLSSLGPYFALDSSLMGDTIEDSEIIYMFQAQTNLVHLLQPIRKLNDLNSISLYLTSPFGMVPDAKPVLAVRLTQDAIYLTRFKKKGDSQRSVVYATPSEQFHPPQSDYFDISSVYSLTPEKFFSDNHFFPFNGSVEGMFLNERTVKSENAGTGIVMGKNGPIIRTLCSVQVTLPDPVSFEEKNESAGFIVVEQVLDRVKMAELKEKLGIDVGVAKGKRLLAGSFTETGDYFADDTLDTILFDGERYYFSQKNVVFSGSSLTKLKAVTFSPVSALSALIRKQFYQIVITGLITAFFTALILLAAIQLIVKRPLKQLMQGVMSLSDGEFSHRVDYRSEDELGCLADAFNDMADDLSRKNCDLKMTVQKLNRSEHYVKNIINSMPSVLVSVDIDGRIIQWNPDAEKITGKRLDEVRERYVWEVLPVISGLTDQLKRALEVKCPVKLMKHEVAMPEGSRFYDFVFYPLTADGLDGAVIKIDDITEKVRMEEMLVQSEKMLSIGGLAAGMAHEINNPLAGILQNMQVVKNRIDADSPKNRQVADECGVSMDSVYDYIERRKIPDMIEAVIDSGKRAARIVQDMLSFSRKSETRFIRHDIGQLLDKTVELASKDYDLKKKYDFRQIEVQREYGKNVPEVPCESSKIQQVFFNILQNGAQAMAARKDRPEPPRFILRVRKEGDMVTVQIEDNGPGMPEDVRMHVFEPFYTTKEVGVGTGLGLSVAYFIITENHGGTLAVESAPGKGTLFTIKLPVTRNGETDQGGEK